MGSFCLARHAKQAHAWNMELLTAVLLLLTAFLSLSERLIYRDVSKKAN
jgi:hypothetical protein